MKYLLTVVLMLVGLISRANGVSDTITYWTISHDKIIILRGNVALKQAPRYELAVKETALKDLVVSFIYDSRQPKTSSLVVKEKNEVLRTIPYDPDMGAYFVVPVRELIGTHQPNVKYELDFYYTDDLGQKNLKLGTIIFSLK